MPCSATATCQVMYRREDRELGATMDRITADINAAKEGMRVNGDVQRRNEGNISNLEMQVRLDDGLLTAMMHFARLGAILQD